MDEKKLISHRGRSIREYVRMLIKRRWAILAVFIIVAGTEAFYTFTEVPLYQATVQILIDRTMPRGLEQGAGTNDYYMTDEYYQTQYKLLESCLSQIKIIHTSNLF